MLVAEGPEGVADAERAEGVADAERAEGVADAGMPEGVADAGMPEGVADAGMPEGVADAEMPEGVADAEMPEGVADAGKPEGVVDAEEAAARRAAFFACTLSQHERIPCPMSRKPEATRSQQLGFRLGLLRSESFLRNRKLLFKGGSRPRTLIGICMNTKVGTKSTAP